MPRHKNPPAPVAPPSSNPAPLYRLVQVRQSHLSGPIERYDLQVRVVGLDATGMIGERWDTIPLLIVAE